MNYPIYHANIDNISTIAKFCMQFKQFILFYLKKDILDENLNTHPRMLEIELSNNFPSNMSALAAFLRVM